MGSNKNESLLQLNNNFKETIEDADAFGELDLEINEKEKNESTKRIQALQKLPRRNC